MRDGGDVERSRDLLADTRRVLEVLNAHESVNKTVLAVRDLNR